MTNTEALTNLISDMINDRHGPAYMAKTLAAPEQSLLVAFHAIFDAKDAAGPGNEVWDAAYMALKALQMFMATVGVPVPRRFDAAR